MTETAVMNKINLLLEADKIYIPKALNSMGLHERSTLLISEIITDNRFKTVDEVKNIVANMSDEYILLYAFGDEKLAKRIKNDVNKVVNQFEKIF